jgi:hypothetical protein
MARATRRLWRPPTADHPHEQTGCAAGGTGRNRTLDLLITRGPYHADYGFYQGQQLQIAHLWVQQRHRLT